MTAGEAAAHGRERLRSAHATARTDAQRLLEFVLGRDAAWILAHPEAPLSSEQSQRYEAALGRRAGGEPVPYITGIAGFYGRAFRVDPGVLVPRPETEHSVMLALAFLESREGSRAPRICDIGTGSGILAVTLALETAANVVAIDVSSRALGLARANARAHGVEGRIEFREGDLLESCRGDEIFDCIVANLPYVATGDLPPPPDPTSFEPRVALDGGPDGLSAYRRLLPAAPRRLSAGGLLLLEAGPANAARLAELARRVFGPRAAVSVEPDFSGLERVVAVRAGGSSRCGPNECGP